MLEKAKQRVYDVLVDTDDGGAIDRIIAISLMALILVNSLAVILETVEELYTRYSYWFLAIEFFSVAIFTVEYLLRVWVAPLDPRYPGRARGRIRYMLSPMAIIDLMVILPAYLPLFFTLDLRIIRILRVFRLFRLLKMNRYVESLRTLDNVIRSKKEELLLTTFMIAILLVFAASLMYLIENEVQPDKFPDIPSAMWWGIATLTTVGYGDVYPVTPIGRLLGGLIAFLGIGIFALPAGILGGGFADELQKRRKRRENQRACPHCGEEL